MKKLLAIAAGALLISGAACTSDEESTWTQYTDWREANTAWLLQKQQLKNSDGTPYYKKVVPYWNPNTYVLAHWFNDTTETAGNLVPLYNSTVDVRYNLHLYDETPVDSSTNNTTPGPGLYRATISNLVQGWAVIMSEMHCGDSVEVLIPYDLGYGASDYGTIKPYSALRFNIRLVDINKYEK